MVKPATFLHDCQSLCYHWCPLQDHSNWDVYLPAFLYTYRTSPHKSMGHTPYKAMLGRAPPSKDRVATESIPMDEWVQELCVAQEEAQKLILANIRSEQQD